MALKSLNIKQIVKRNPAIDPAVLLDALKLIGNLRSTGIGRPEYNLASPYDRRMVGLSGDQPAKSERKPDLFHQHR